ncbi:uncharacterized protein cubi_01093 [Cryptosporidium ubiquitum]|uniref:Uncharacterized protein n=1 Tax=Cryptosporidium ubiquitum TaxID=857276 RepID=A0A1J4MJ40_9CRYT|nr:uncharacterized protein cubi_01093 [Cryptosporidium ubiquitum]OII74249.1 hypothetical protein cubi_01093 [Cryptosporidium ubiquitum]
MQLRSKVNHNVAEYFRKNLQITSANLSDSNMPFPYKHEFFSGLIKLPFLSSEPEYINFPINQSNIQECFTTLYDCTSTLQINMIPRHDIGFSNDSIEAKDMIENQFNKNHISLDDLELIDEETIGIYNGTKMKECNINDQSVCIEGNGKEISDQGVKLLHPIKQNVKAISILDIIPLDMNHCSTFQVMLDSKEENVDTILELDEGWKRPFTRFSFYNKIEGKLYKYDRDYSSTLPREYTKSYIISLPKHFVECNKNKTSETADSRAYLISTKSPKLLLSKVSSAKRKPKIKLL